MHTIDKTGWVVGAVLAKQGEMRHDMPFVQFEDHAPFTFGAMDESATRIANGLAALGIQHSERLLVMLPNSVEFLQVWFGSNRLGAVFVPINTAYKGAFLEHVINNAGARVIVIARAFVSILRAVEANVPWLDTVIVVDTPTPEASLPYFARLHTVSFTTLLQHAATPVQRSVS